MTRMTFFSGRLLRRFATGAILCALIVAQPLLAQDHPVWDGRYTSASTESFYIRFNAGMFKSYRMPSGYQPGQDFDLAGTEKFAIPLGLEGGLIWPMVQLGLSLDINAPVSQASTPEYYPIGYLPGTDTKGGGGALRALFGLRLPWRFQLDSVAILHYAGLTAGLGLGDPEASGLSFTGSLYYELQFLPGLSLRFHLDPIGLAYRYDHPTGFQEMRPAGLWISLGFSLSDYSMNTHNPRFAHFYATDSDLNMFGEIE